VLPSDQNRAALVLYRILAIGESLFFIFNLSNKIPVAGR
jgi:hypothetical protein